MGAGNVFAGKHHDGHLIDVTISLEKLQHGKDPLLRLNGSTNIAKPISSDRLKSELEKWI